MDTKNFINYKIKKETYTVSDNKTSCTIVCKTNLKEFERQSFYFNEHFIRHTIGKYLPLIKVIRKPIDDIYCGQGDIVAKYYIEPGKKARIMYFDNDYFNNVRNHNNNEFKNRKHFNYNVGDIVDLKNVCNASEMNGEVSEYSYLETFSITGKSVCLPDDTFDETKGKRIALSKAMLFANYRIGKLYTEIKEHFESNVDLINGIFFDMSDKELGLIDTIAKNSKN